MDEHLQTAVPILSKWAATKHRIRRVWLYGSRVKDTHRPDSDLDVCLEIDPLNTEEEKELVQGQQKIWRYELSALCGMKVHLEPYATEQQKGFIAAGAELIYEREG
jgi:uncharacterized protein